MSKCRNVALPIILSIVVSAHATAETFSIGRAASVTEIAAWDIDVRYDGVGLPPGAGDVETGEALFEFSCASCHGDFGQGEGRWPALSGGYDSLTLQGGTHRPEKTVGSYWPYAPILFDYIRRAMPYTAPQSLSPDEVYALSAYVLYLNGIVDDDFVADAGSLATVDMPNRDNFFEDPRPDVDNVVCMEDCLEGQALSVTESIKGVTPSQNKTAGDSTTASTQAAAIYNRACSLCHASGVARAPIAKASGKEDWQARFEALGMDGLTTSALNGKGAMPSQEKSGLSREEVLMAIQYMLQSAGVDGL